MMDFNTLTTSDGVRLRYAYCSTSDAKPWITLIIPFGLNADMARPFFEFFEPHYNVCTWESRTVLEDSEREPSAGEFSIDNHASDALAVMDALSVERSILVGYCSGAGVALALINLAPDRFDELILAHGEYTLLKDAKCTTPFAADMDQLLCLAAGSEARAQLVYEKIQAERFGADATRPEGLDRPFSDVRFLKRYAENYLAYKSVDFERLAADIAHPTLLLAGGKDVQVNISSSQKIHDHMRNARLFIDPDADHYGVLTDNSQTMIAIWNYICENAHGRRELQLHSRHI